MADEKDKPAGNGQNEKKKPAPSKATNVKKSVPASKASSKKAAPAARISATELGGIKSELHELSQQNSERAAAHDAKLGELMAGLETTFGHIHKSSSEQTQKLSSLMIGLEKTFQSIHSGTQSRDRSNTSSLDQVSQTIIRSSEELRKEYEEMERLQEKKLAAEKERHQHSFKVLKVIAVPAIILALLGIGHMFYTVTVMEKAMTAMSADMKAMRGSMGEMTTSVGGMNNNMQMMRQDMGVLTRNVAPAMSGMRQMMPWAPY